MILDGKNNSSYICSICGKPVFPTVCIERNEILINTHKNQIRGGKGNNILKDNVCDKCVEKMRLPYELF